MHRSAALLGALLALASPLACGSSTSTPSSPSTTGDAGAEAQTPAKPTPTCTTPTTPCGDTCVNRNTDVKNCGTCGAVCKAGQVCAAGTCAQSVAFTISSLFWGDTDRAGVPSSTAWKSYGLNIDGLTSTSSSTDLCKLAPGAPKGVQNDGTGGIDNAFGANIVPIFLSIVGSDWGKKYNDDLAAGTGLLLLDLRGFSGETDLPLLSVRVLGAADYPGKPKLDGTDRWPVLSSSFDGTGKAVVSFDAAKLAGGVLDTGPRSGSLLVPHPFVPVPIEKVRITGTIAGTRIRNGVISGVIPFAKMEALFRDNAGRVSASLCAGEAVENVVAQLRQASDILVDGTQDPAKACDGISIGLGFEGVGVEIGDTVKPADPLPNPCK